MSNEATVTFSTVLHWLRYHEVRAIVAALGLGRRATENQKGAWIAAIAAAWLDPVRQAPFLDRLSPAAHGALWRLRQGGALPRGPAQCAGSLYHAQTTQQHHTGAASGAACPFL